MSVNVTADLLALNGDKALILSLLRDDRQATWASPALLGRLRNLGLITITNDVKTLTELGVVVADLLAGHMLVTSVKPLGRGTIRGAGMRYGTKARCSCGDWKWETNESGAAARRSATRAHIQHTLDVHVAS